jgi:ATP-binding cassette subfamily C (CFTR/MRP) protein 2
MKVESGSVTPFAKAGFLSRMLFWWLNPLMKKGRKKILEEENCYSLFLEQLNKQKRAKPSILKAIILCHWKEIFLTGCFALLKVLTVSAGPLLLNSFILVAEGKKKFQVRRTFTGIIIFLSKEHRIHITKAVVLPKQAYWPESEIIANCSHL